MNQNNHCERKLIFDEQGINDFAFQVRKNRIRQGFSQSQLAFESGLSLSQIARIETSRINPTICTAFALSRALNIPLTTLFSFELAPKLK